MEFLWIKVHSFIIFTKKDNQTSCITKRNRRSKNLKVHYKTVKTNEVVNTTGAGNALFACFLHYYQETGDSTLAIKNAMLFASYKIGYMGTSNGFMTVEQLEQWRSLIWGGGKPGLL